MAETIDVKPGDRPQSSAAAQSPLWGRRVLTVGIALAAIGGFAAVVIYSYDSGKAPGAGVKAPVITAQEGPTKVRPKEPGGMAVPNRDKQIYGRLTAAEKPAQEERLLPPPEAVVSRPAEPEMEKAAKQLSAIAPASGKTGDSIDIPPPPPAAQNTTTTMAAIRPDRTSEKKPVAATTRPPRQVAKLSKAPAKMAGAAYLIQIASLRSQGDAKKAWGRLVKQHKDLFSTLQSKIVRVELKGKGTFYRLQAGPLVDKPSARTLCSQLKKRKIGCLVVKQ